jgi:glyoxylase-like metal-dependent hydrolase (beta-lactamase superfamily II)
VAEAQARATNDVAPGISMIDTQMAGVRSLNAVYLIAAARPTLVETGPGADLPSLRSGLDALGLDPEGLANIVVTHVHIDHAGAAGALLRAYPRATLWIHERGAPHAIDPSRLVASTTRTYGEDRMRRLFGDVEPCEADRVRALTDGDRIDLGDDGLQVVHAPGHASHHIALHDERSGALFTGEAIGTYLPWADSIRPALPPPEVDVEAALATIARLRDRRPTRLLTSHFGPVDEVDRAFATAAKRIRSWADHVRASLHLDPDAATDTIAEDLRRLARSEFETDASRPFDEALADPLGSIRMNASGLARYFRKQAEAESGLTT